MIIMWHIKKKKTVALSIFRSDLKKRKVTSSVLPFSCTQKVYRDIIHRATQWPNKFFSNINVYISNIGLFKDVPFTTVTFVYLVEHN